MKGKVIKNPVFSTSLLLIFSLVLLFIVPVKVWHYSDGTLADTVFEKFGPRADKLLIRLYADETAEWDALARGEIDITDSPLTKEYYDNFTSTTINPSTGQPYNETINTVLYGAEFRIFLLDINNNSNEFLGNPPDTDYPNPVYPNPGGVKEFRQAMAHLVNRSQLDAIVGEGLYVPMYTLVPPSMGGYAHPEIRPGGALENLTYPYSRAAAEALLDANGFPVNSSTGWRYWDRNSNGVEDADELLELKFYIRSDHPHRRDFGTLVASELETVQIRVNSMLVTSGTAFTNVMVNKDFHLYTGGYGLGDAPADLYSFLYSDGYWHPGFSYNYNGVMDWELNNWLDLFRFAENQEEALTASHMIQEVFARNAFKVPLWSYSGSKAMSRFYTGGNGWQPLTPNDGENAYRGKYWEGIVNRPRYGIDNFWSLLNMHSQGNERGDGENMTIRWGFKVPDIKQLNPVYSSWLYDWNVLNQIYESLLVRNPYNMSEFIPWLAEDYEAGTYIHPMLGTVTKVRFTMRAGATWQDGTPITTADVHFTFVELKQIIASRGLQSPWWWPNVQDILGFKIMDAYNFEVLFEVMSVFVLDWLSNTPILPKHVWKPIAESGDPRAFTPDPNMIGSGPWRFKEYVEGSHVLMVANKPGSTVTSSNAGSTPITSPEGYWRYNPVSVGVRVNGTTEAKIDYYTQPYTLEYTITNLYFNGNITVDIAFTYPSGATHAEMGTVIPAGGNWTHSWTGDIKGLRTTSIEVNITAPSEFEGSYSWSHVYYGTLIMYSIQAGWINDYGSGPDIFGSTFYDDIGLAGYPYKIQLPTPDFKADILDIATAALAFGSYPGHARWNPIADINGDYKIDIADIAPIGIQFGWVS